MKKTLLALAAIAASSAAMAQSTVTLYGVADLSIENVKGDKSVTRVSSDNLSTSRFGLKGTEDIGGGLKGIFALESGLKVDTGATDSARFFNRAAWAGLSGSFGTARLGRVDSSIGDVAGNILSAQPVDDFVITGTRAGSPYRRVDNAVTYDLPKLVDGLSAQLQYSTAAVGTTKSSTTAATANTGVETPGSDYGKSFGFSTKYVGGPISAGLAYLNIRDDDASKADSQKANATLVYAGYDLGVAKVTGYYNVETNPKNNLASSADRNRLWLGGVKIAVPVSPELVVTTGLSTAHNVNGSAKSDDNVQIVSVKAVYALSKRTSLYGILTNVNNDAGTYLGVDSTKNSSTSLAGSPVTTKDATTRALALGIRHAF